MGSVTASHAPPKQESHYSSSATDRTWVAPPPARSLAALAGTVASVGGQSRRGSGAAVGRAMRLAHSSPRKDDLGPLLYLNYAKPRRVLAETL